MINNITLTVDNGASAQAALPAGSTVDVSVSYLGSDLTITSLDPNLDCPTVSAGQVFPGMDIDPGAGINYQGSTSFTCTTINPIMLGSSNQVSVQLTQPQVPTANNNFLGFNGASIIVAVPLPAIDIAPGNNAAFYIGAVP